MSTVSQGKEFEDRVAELFRLMGYKIEQNIEVCHKKVDILATLQIPGADTVHRIIVECKQEAKNINQAARVREFQALLREAREQNKAESAEIITSKPWSDQAKGAASGSGVALFTYNQKLAQLMNFDEYLTAIIEDFENDELSKYYIDLDAKRRSAAVEKSFAKEEQEIFSPVDRYIDNWLEEESKRNRIAILGEFGSGKTSFCRHYAYEMAKKYRQDHKEKVRIPILFNLGRFTKNVDFEDMIVGYLDRKCYVSNPKFNIFKKMNDEGLFLLIFDGFDEMAMQVDFDIIVANIMEIEKLAKSPKCKALVTSRPEYFISEKEEEDIFASDSLLARERKFDRLDLVHLSEAKIKTFLQRRIPLIDEADKDWHYYFKKIGEIHDLSDLSRRPVMLDMITKTLPKLIKSKETINAANLYQTYLEEEIKRQAIDKKRRLLIRREHRFTLMQTLALHFYNENPMGVTAAEVKQIIKYKFTTKQLEELEAHLREFLTCSFLIREGDYYRFSHRSLVEYLTAKGLCEEIREDKADAFKINPLTKEVRDFILEIKPDTKNLWKWIERTKEKYFRDVEYSGGNALTLLNLLGEELKGKDFSHTVLNNAYLHSADLSGTSFKGAILEKSNLNYSILKKADFSQARLEGITLEEMSGVRCVVFSPDGKYMASGGEDNTVKIWDTAKFIEITTLKRQTNWIRSIAFSPDGKYLVSGGDDNTVEIWETEKFTETTALSGHTNNVWSVTFSPDGKYVASGSFDKTIKIWDTAKLIEIVTLRGHAGSIWGLAFSPGGRYLASGSADHTVKIWEKETFKEMSTLTGHTNHVLIVGFSPDGKYLASASDDKTVKVWDAAKFIEITTLKGHYNLGFGLAFSPDGKYLASASADNTVKIWNVEKFTEIITLKGHTSVVDSLAYSPDGKYLASGSRDKTVRIWDANPESKDFGKCSHVLEQQINCEGMNLTEARGLTEEQIEFLKEQGAVGLD